MNRIFIEIREARAHVLSLLERIPLLDGHNDLADVIRNDSVARGDIHAFRLDQIRKHGDTDIPRMRAGRLSAQIFAAFVPSESPRPEIETLEQIDLILRMQEAHSDVFMPATSASDIMKAKLLGKIASIIAVEGGVGMGESLAALRVWHAAGVRLMTLCHNGSLSWVDSATDTPRAGGLNGFGQNVIKEMNRLGMMIDCAHVSDEVMRQVLTLSVAPVVFSHSNARALCDHVRNVPDDVLARIPSNDGIVMATFIPKFVSDEVRAWMEILRRQVGGVTLPLDWAERLRAYEETNGKSPVATVQQVADHVEYLASKVGPSRVGIGSDFWGGPDTPEGLADVSCFPTLLTELVMRGWSDDHIAGLAALNFIRVFETVERIGTELRRTHLPIVATASGCQ